MIIETTQKWARNLVVGRYREDIVFVRDTAALTELSVRHFDRDYKSFDSHRDRHVIPCNRTFETTESADCLLNFE
jgi:hypothetical protein